MSRFRILQINHYDPEVAGRKKRKLFTVYSLFTPLTIITFNYLFQAGHSSLLLPAIILAVLTTVYLYAYLRLRNEPRNLKTIGDIEFSRNMIKKRIGDATTEYNLDSIKLLELERHIPSVTPSNSKSGYFSYILRITFKNSRSESLVVSDKPVEGKQNISIVDTITTLKKLIHTEVVIEK